MRMSSFLLSLAAVAGLASAARGEKVISINFCQVSSADMRIVSDAAVATPVGTIPGSAWAQSTQNGATSAYTFSGAKECVITDGSVAAQDLASAFSVSEYMVNMANHGQITTSSGSNMSPVLKSWLGFKNPGDLTKKSSQVIVSNIPYATYDAIVIMSGYTSTHYCDGVAASRVEGTDFPAVTVNGTAYTYSNGATVVGSGSWGQRGNDAIAVGTNALRINGLSGNLTLDLSAADFGIAGIQIVERGTTQVAREVAADAEVDWSDPNWTVGGDDNESFSPVAGGIYNVTVTVGGDCTIAMPASIGSFDACSVNFALAENVPSANVTLKYIGTLSTDSATTANINPFGAATVTAGEGVALTPVYDGDTTGYVTSASGAAFLAAKRPSIGVVSVRIGARTQNASGGYIDPAYSAVGPYPMSGLFWEQTKFWNDNSTSGNYTDIQNLTDAKDDSDTIRIGYYGHNTYYNSSANDVSSPNQVLTKTYLDDSSSGDDALTATASSGDETITLPSPGHTRGWQLHFENIPYNAYDVYFITASDVENGSLKECPIYVSLDGGTNWKSYVGDSENKKTVMGTAAWTGLPFARDGALVEGKNYLKMRITKSLYGDDIDTIDITHGRRDTSKNIRSGLAAIQIVEVKNDGVYTLAQSGKWSDAVWNVGDLTGQTWTDIVDGAASIAKIASSETVSTVTVDQNVSAGSVILTGSSDFTVAGDKTLTVETAFDASDFAGALNLQAPIQGTIYIGANTSLEFGGDTDMSLPGYTLDGAGAWTKVGSGTLTVNSSFALPGTVTGGILDVASSYAGNLALNGGNLRFSGPTGDGAAEVIFSGAATLAENASGLTTVASGVVQSRGSFATDIDVLAGAKLKLGSQSGFGGSGSAPSGKTITVKEGGVIELNGVEGCNAYTLDGGTLQNTGEAITTESRQTMALTLTTNSTVHAGSDFGLLNNGYGATTLNLGGHTLKKTGDAKFWLYNTRSEQGGTIEIQAGSVYAYSTVSLPNVAFNIAEGAELKVRTGNFTVGELSGTGTVDVGTYRPTSALNFANGSALEVKIVLTSTTESLIEIPCTGTPDSVTVYGTDAANEDSAATVSYENGKIVVRVDVADLTRTNPVTAGSQAFTYAFLGVADSDWKNINNWKSASGNRWSDVTGTIPARPSSEKWDPILLDGDLIAYSAGADGYKSVSITTLEGWKLQVGCLNGVKLTIDTAKKHQGGCWYWVDETSKLVLGAKGSDNNGGNVDFYIAAKDGVLFNSDFDFSGCTVNYSFSGDGSAVYQVGSTRGTHNIKRVKLPVGSPQSKLKKLIKRRLVSFGSNTYGNVAFGLGNAEVTSADTTLTMTKFTPPEETPDARLTTDEPFGTYQLTQDSTGVYITYVGYAVPFRLYLR